MGWAQDSCSTASGCTVAVRLRGAPLCGKVLWDGVRIECGGECVRCYVNVYMMQWVDIRWTWWGTLAGVASDEVAGVVRKFAGSGRPVDTEPTEWILFFIIIYVDFAFVE